MATFREEPPAEVPAACPRVAPPVREGTSPDNSGAARLPFRAMPAPERIPYAVRLLRQRVSGPAAPAFDMVEPAGALHRIGAAEAAPAFTLRLVSDRAW